MKDDDKPIVNPYVLLREEFDDWAVLFDPDTGHGFGLSPTGVFVWQLLDGQHAVDAVVEEVRGHAEGVPHDVGEHVRAFVDVLVTQGLAGLAGAVIDLAASTAKPGQLASPAGRGSEAKPFNYEPPNLVNLNSVQAARGDCGGGSGVSGNCTPHGNGASWQCLSGWSAGNIGYCGDGHSGYMCSSGYSPNAPCGDCSNAPCNGGSGAADHCTCCDGGEA